MLFGILYHICGIKTIVAFDSLFVCNAQGRAFSHAEILIRIGTYIVSCNGQGGPGGIIYALPNSVVWLLLGPMKGPNVLFNLST